MAQINSAGYTSEEVSALITRITATFQPRPFDGRCPYKGLDVFVEEDAELFFGREKLVDDLVSRVKDSRTIFVTGPSGSGKSSLVRAGLIHALKQGAIKGSERWLYATLKPGRDPIGELARVASSLTGTTNAEEEIRAKAIGEEGIFTRWCEIALKEGRDKRIVLFIDQFEEAFTMIGNEAERVAFFNLLTHTATVENGRVIILFSMRSDFVTNFAAYPKLNLLLNQQFVQIGAMQPDELVSAIAQPALRVGLRIDPDLIAQIINEMKGEPGALPLMQFALKDLFDSQQEKSGTIALTLNDYLQRGGIHKALERHADASFSKLSKNEQELARSIFSGLIEIGRNTQDTRRTALFEELIPANAKAADVQAVIQKLADARLITIDEQAGKETVTISNERLILAWPWLNKLVNENRDVIALQNEISEDAKEWDEHRRDSSYLYTGTRLANAREQIETKKLVLSGLAQEFIASGTRRRFSPGALAQGLFTSTAGQQKKNPLNETKQELGATNEADASVDEQPDSTAVTDERKMVIDPARMAVLIENNRFINNRSQKLFNDQAQGEDSLGIAHEVYALADTLLLRDIEPPVAVGIMGGWGSGKSFVMHLIKKHVADIRAKTVKKGWQDLANSGSNIDPNVAFPPPFVGHIYQIHFNAWTYAKSNLWASLMQTVFFELNQQMRLEQLLAHKDFAKGSTPSVDEIRASMMNGGDVFKKIYKNNLQILQDEELKPWRDNLIYWSTRLLDENLLWHVMRSQQVDVLIKLRDTDEQVRQLKSRREQFEKEWAQKKIGKAAWVDKWDQTARQAYYQSIKNLILSFASDMLETSVKDALTKQGATEDEIKKALEEAKEALFSLKGLFTIFRRNKLYLFWTVLCAVLTIILFVAWPRLGADSINSLINLRLSALLVTLLPGLMSVIKWLYKAITFNRESQKIVEGAYKTQQAKVAEKIISEPKKSYEQRIADLQKEIANGSIAAYDSLVGLLETHAEEQRRQVGPSAQYASLLEFVQSRLNAATYETQLGLMQQVKQDIDELTFSLVDHAKPDVFPRGKPRIFLYIDDLDRCPPVRVVEVLEAVQLLLNTELFVVVLGLDTRYVTRALEKEYKEILQHEGDPSGLDYIEKIVQIPYRVRSIEPEGLKNYLANQMELETSPEPATENQPVQDGDKFTVTSETVTTNPDEVSNIPVPASDVLVKIQDKAQGVVEEKEDVESAKTIVDPGLVVQEKKELKSIQAIADVVSVAQEKDDPLPIKAAIGTATAPQEKLEEPEIELPAAVIQFKKEDLDDLAICCEKISLTPRSIKRLVNVLKLMKIFWFRSSRDDRPRSVKQAAICMLALSSAYPEVMRETFVQVENLYRRTATDVNLFDTLERIKLPPKTADEITWQFEKYKHDIKTLKMHRINEQDNFGQITLGKFGLSTFNLVRSFSFIGDPMYWSDSEEDKPKLVDASEP